MSHRWTVAALACLAGTACAQPWSSVRFDESAPPEVRAAELTHDDGSASNLVWMEVDGRGGWFILDTGASVALLDDDFADALGLEATGNVRANGAPASLRRASRATIGPVAVEKPLFVALDLDALFDAPGVGRNHRVVGIVGHWLLQNAVVRIEYGADEDRVFLYDSRSYRLPPHETWMRFRLEDDAPAVPATINGAEGLFKLDTGKSFAASIEADFADAHQLEDGVELQLEDNRRVEGTVQEAAGRIDWIELAGLRIDRPLVGFRRERGSSSSALDGVIGRAILAEFTLTVDYPGSRLSLQPN